ncbi:MULTISPECIES: DUF262 domain-containing protein [Okeania]|uniref:DUF262 domain-containing protein n=1 Tax=Okeania hirsuta TaxID=1458930 RepID=A0A3N6PHV0_9CYAN|nr:MULTISPECIES: DUF262 domain-containing protein [Okeania]NES77816.1 DUF262 domain-containing protein [Okeania sp. SIO1H4]NET13782.1 DUF262 domain-containing protein [Okeania sp. SIO1H6]NET22816.1 DUF262 domain-containing protein [Okeania sp. SIO1H5]NET79294.1 DUF262 domain-containing protein [Okeania sp. SIO1F9]NET97027.1 DUF262 domain-containing protein [Okeania sp. SIO1H2]
MKRTINFQTISWFWDLYQRELLDLDPSYQRRSVWNQDYKDYFIDTVLHEYPAPAIFIYQEISPEGVSKVSIVDGKQRLSTLFQFVNNEFPVSEKMSIQRFRGKYFQDLETKDKQDFWKYQFAIEYLPSSDEDVISNIFDRINRNVIKLTPQELRHARLSGDFITLAEELSNWMFNYLEEKIKNFPNLHSTPRKQMKDVEMVAQLLLFLEEGAKSYSADYLDRAFTNRDSEWEEKDEIEDEFRKTIKSIGKILDLSLDLKNGQIWMTCLLVQLLSPLYLMNKRSENFVKVHLKLSIQLKEDRIKNLQIHLSLIQLEFMLNLRPIMT